MVTGTMLKNYVINIQTEINWAEFMFVSDISNICHLTSFVLRFVPMGMMLMMNSSLFITNSWLKYNKSYYYGNKIHTLLSKYP